ncbi:zf-HC2 domain-containing protein, partial [Ilumatobacter sp.]|uniref:zf-HC2 domain-containing protein n=1 Tax=Ilumatobacter sp. TaxID=1967498 RepID=UPI003C51FC2F
MNADPLPCATAHEILSSRIDGEATERESERLDLHLTGCDDCRALEAQFMQIDRRVRLRPAAAVPDLRPAILSRSRPAALGRNGWRRPALA